MSIQRVIGIHSCREALRVRSSKYLKKLYLRPDWDQNSSLLEIVRLAKGKHIKPEVLSLKKLNRFGEAHQGVCVEADYHLTFDIFSTGPSSTVLILDRIQDPRNFGAIIRTAWLMGVDCIFSSLRDSAGLSPSVIKTASGGIEHIPIEFMGNLGACIEALKQNAFWIYALDSQSKTSLWQEKLEGRKAFVLGGESSGLRPGLGKNCDKFLSIPQKQSMASYNVSVAAALILGESSRQAD